MSLKKLGGETIIYGLANILPRLLNFVLVTPFLTEIMAGEDYGVVGVMFMWIGLITVLLVFRMDTVVFRFASRAGSDSRAVFVKAQRFVLAMVVTVIGTALFFSREIADLMQYPDRPVYVLLFLIAVAFDCLSGVPQARLRLEERSWFFVTTNLVNIAVNLALIFILLYYWPKVGVLFGMEYDGRYQVAYYLFTIAAASGIRYLMLLVDGLIRYGSRVGGQQEHAAGIPSLKTMLIYSAPLTLVGVAAIFNALSGPWMIKYYFGGNITQNLYWSGQFSAALKLAVILNLCVTAYQYAAEPFFFRQAGKDPATADKQIYADAMRAFTILGSLACAGILIFLPWIKNFIGEDLQEGLYVLPWLLAGNFCLGLYSNFSIAYKLTDKTFLGGLIAAAGSIVLASIGIGLMGQYGFVAPAAGMLACYFVMCVLAYLVTRRYFPVPYPLVRMALFILLAAASIYLALSLDAMFWIRCLLFLGLVAVIGLLERKWIKKMLF